MSERDFVQAYRANRNRTTFSEWARRIFVGFIVAMMTVGFVTFLLSPNVEARKNLIPLCLFAVIGISIFWALPRWTMRRQFRKQPAAHGSRTLLLDATGMHWRWDGGSGDIEWKNYIRWVEDKNQILLYTSPVISISFPNTR